MPAATLTVLLDHGVGPFQRVIAILAHQRISIRSMALEPLPDEEQTAQLTAQVDASFAALEQLIKRLERSCLVHSATAQGGGEAGTLRDILPEHSA